MCEKELEIRDWMRRHVEEFEDVRTGEIDCTAMVETWDVEEGTGEETLDEFHPAWDIAVDVAGRFVADRSKK